MLELPEDCTDPIALADWLELFALKSPGQNASGGDLISALQIPFDQDKAQEMSLLVIAEIEERIRATGEAYPFELIRGRMIQAKGHLGKYAAYLFCLFLSYFKWRQEKKAPINPWLLFEDLACVAARQYVQGEVLQFGTSRKKGIAAFSDAVKTLTIKLGEGGGFRDQLSLSKKDDHVDLVAWKDFKDDRTSKFILFGQCAAGANWEGKLGELDPQAFWKQWMVDGEVSPLTKSFYVPHRISEERWDYCGRYAGILFDRCRVAYWAWSNNDAVLHESRYITWCRSVFEFEVG